MKKADCNRNPLSSSIRLSKALDQMVYVLSYLPLSAQPLKFLSCLRQDSDTHRHSPALRGLAPCTLALSSARHT